MEIEVAADIAKGVIEPEPFAEVPLLKPHISRMTTCLTTPPQAILEIFLSSESYPTADNAIQVHVAVGHGLH